MNIIKIISAGLSAGALREKKSKEEVQAKPAKVQPSDKVELSAEAKALFEADQAKRLKAIEEKMADGFYHKQEVTEKVVDGLLKDLKPRSGS